LQQGCPGHVVEADDGDVGGNGQLRLGDGLEDAEGHEVVGHEHRVGAFDLVQQLLHSQLTA
jgi:hypothetical protein